MWIFAVCRKQSGKKRSREIGEGYKIIYSKKMSTRNGIGVIKGEEMKGIVVMVVKKSDRVIMVKVVSVNKLLNIVSEMWEKPKGWVLTSSDIDGWCNAKNTGNWRYSD